MRKQLQHFRLGVIGALSVACVLAMAPVAKAAELTAPVVTSTGTYQGLMNFQEQPGDPATGVNAFFGIRYGQAPEGVLRWKPPQAPNPGQGSIVAESFGHTCPQGRGTDSEDCLFLNVYAPSTVTAKSKLPVWIWIHGGALTGGAGSDYDPSVMVAENNIIVVTINYRLRSLGFLAASVLAATEANAFQNVGDAGNYGLMDQQFAMAWVQNNIAAFGGDRKAVTIGGESAGGLSVSAHLASTDTVRHLTGHELFHRAIIESGAYMYHDVPSLATYQTLSNSFVQKDATAFCPGGTVTLACLQGLTTTQLFANEGLFGGFGIAPNFNTKILPLDLRTAFSTGQFNQVPVLQGTNANEGRLFEPDFFPRVVTQPFGTGPTIVAAGGPASFDLQVPNILCASPQFSANTGGLLLLAGDRVLPRDPRDGHTVHVRPRLRPSPRQSSPLRRRRKANTRSAISTILFRRPPRRYPASTTTSMAVTSMRRSGRFSPISCLPVTALIQTATCPSKFGSLPMSSTIRMPRARPVSRVRVRMAPASPRLLSMQPNSSTSSTSVPTSPPRKRGWQPT